MQAHFEETYSSKTENGILFVNPKNGFLFINYTCDQGKIISQSLLIGNVSTNSLKYETIKIFFYLVVHEKVKGKKN